MSKAMRPEILVIAKTAPLHDRAGSEHRLFQILRMLAESSSVDFLSTWHAVLHKFKERPVSYVVRDGTFSRRNLEFLDEEYFEDLRAIGVRPLNEPEPLPFIVRPTNDYDIRPFLLKKQYDVIWVQYFYQADQYMDQIRQLQPWAHVIVDSVDLHYHRMERQCWYLENRVKYSVNAEQERTPLGDDFQRSLRDHRNYAAHVKEHELRTYGKCDRIVVASRDDEAELKAQLPRSETILVPNVQAPQKSATIPAFKSRSGIVFVGNFDHGPNSSAAIFLKHEVAPAMAERMPPVPIYIVGSNPPYLIRNMEKLGPCAGQFRVTGHVPDTRKYLDKARVSVAPILFGAGMNRKIIEALAAGVPVVTTALGAQGLQLEHGVHCLVAETAEEFAAQIQRLHEDEELWKRLSVSGMEFLEKNLSMSAVAPEFRKQLLSAIDLPAIRNKQKAAGKRKPISFASPISLAPAKFPAANNPEISVIVLAYNQWAYTDLCLRSLSHAQALHPGLRVEYILVDNASSDGTAELARKIPGLKVIANSRNLGFAAGNNVGIRESRGENVVLLNNDTIVPPSWLHRLHGHAQRIDKVGIIGPSTNTESGQALFGARYNGISEFFSYNRDIGRNNAGQWELIEKISGLCMYIPRAVIDEVGLLSEEYGIGYFEDDDYCFRVHDAGYRTLWAKDTYVHHFGSVSFENSAKSSREKHLHNGMSQFIFKWGNRALKHVAKSHRQTLIKPAEFQLRP